MRPRPDDQASRTSVILVNYNGAEDTRWCVASLAGSRSLPKLVVVDNGSNVGDVEGAIAGYPGAKELIYAPANVGFGRGNNIGIRWALSSTDCEFVFLLNNDAAVEPDTIGKLEDALDSYPEAGIASPRIVLAEDPNLLWYASGEVDWRKGVARVGGYLGPANAKHALLAKNVTFASGCAMLVRRSVLEEVGGFDPRFFMYEEDLELCLRIQKKGWTIRYVPKALVLHKGQGTQRKGKEAYVPELSARNPRLPFYMFHRVKNRLLNMSIHARGTNALRFAVFFPAFLLYKCFGFALRGRWDGIRAVVLGLREFGSLIKEPFVDELKSEQQDVFLDERS